MAAFPARPAAFCAFILATSALQPGNPVRAEEAKPVAGPTHFSETPPLFTALDANIDGVVTREEYARHRAEVFRELDRDGDAALSIAEWRRPHGARTLRSPTVEPEHSGAADAGELTARFRRADLNENGIISRPEWDRHGEVAFGTYDTDSSGDLLPSELYAPQ